MRVCNNKNDEGGGMAIAVGGGATNDKDEAGGRSITEESLMIQIVRMETPEHILNSIRETFSRHLYRHIVAGKMVSI
jgi:hypothetical protein